MPAPTTTETLVDRSVFLNWYRRNRERSQSLFDLLRDDAYYGQPILLRHPIVFYEGHLPAFSFNTVVKKALGQSSIDEALERLFARGIDPHESDRSGRKAQWPDRETVRAFAAEADKRVVEALEHADLDQPGHPLLDRSEAVFAILEHEAMHQETLLYMLHRMPFEQKNRPTGYQPNPHGRSIVQEWIDILPGEATLGANRSSIRFGWDNERPARHEAVGAFSVERYDTTNEAFLEFIEQGGYEEEKWWRPEDWGWIREQDIDHPLFWERHDGEWYWRGMFDLVPLPLSWPVYVSHAEASAYARWRDARLPSEAEFQRAAFATPEGNERVHPWGDAEPSLSHGVFDFASWDPHPVGSHPAGRSAWGVEDLVGNGWEWTDTVFAPFPGFTAMASYPEYSADFFDGEHFVMKGASPATARELLRPTFRNWFRARYPYVYATFRCARSAA